MIIKEIVKNSPILIMYAVVFIVLCVALSIKPKPVSEWEIKKEAIRAGVAYYTNNAAGESVFKWKEAKP